MSDKIENSNFSGNPSVMMRKGHKHKRSFALSGENFEFLQPNSNNNTIIGKTQRSSSNGSLPEFLDINRADKNDSSKQNSLSNNVVIDFDDAEKFMLSKNNKPASLRHKRSETNTTMEDHINNSWENDYKTEDDFQNNNNRSSTELLIEEDENESSSENGSPIKQRQLDPTANVTLSTPATTINTTGKYKVSSRNFSDNSYRSITPSSATSGTGNSYRSIAKPQRERYYNFGIPYSPQGSRNSSNGSHKSNNNSSVNSGGSLSASTPTSNNPTINSSNSNNNNTNSSNLSLKKSTPSMRLNGYVSGSSNSAKYSPRMSYMSGSNNNNGTKSPFNFKPQEYDISKDLEELKDLNDEENNNNNTYNNNSSNDNFDNNVDRNNTENTFVENKKESISTILNSNHPSNSTNINNTNRSSQTPKHSSYNNSISRHSRQLTDTDSNLTLLISTTNNNNNTNKQANISETSFVDGISVIEEPENENSVLIGVGSVSSEKENDYVPKQLPTSPPLFHNDYKEPSKTCTNTNNTQKTNNTINAKPNRKKLSIPSSISMSNLSIKSFSTVGGDKKRANNDGSERPSSSSGLKKSLSIQSLSKYLNKRSDNKPSSEDKPVDSKRRGSFMSRLFTRKG
ncbi:hypothetical protein ACO0SA_002612 [Hanseniaspora valbyensis]